MSVLKITGGKPLAGKVKAAGAKNAVHEKECIRVPSN